MVLVVTCAVRAYRPSGLFPRTRYSRGTPRPAHGRLPRRGRLDSRGAAALPKPSSCNSPRRTATTGPAANTTSVPAGPAPPTNGRSRPSSTPQQSARRPAGQGPAWSSTPARAQQVRHDRTVPQTSYTPYSRYEGSGHQFRALPLAAARSPVGRIQSIGRASPDRSTNERLRDASVARESVLRGGGTDNTVDAITPVRLKPALGGWCLLPRGGPPISMIVLGEWP